MPTMIHNTRLEAKIDDYNKAAEHRRDIISQNASRRIKRSALPLLPVPPKPSPVMVPFAFEPDGTYGGVLDDPADLPPGMVLRWKAHNEPWKD